MNDLTTRIQELMEARELTRQQFAALTHISLSTLSNIFNARSQPTLKQVQAIIAAFPSINQQWLISGSGEMFLPADAALPAAAEEAAPSSGEPSLFDFCAASPTLSAPAPPPPAAAHSAENVPAPVVKEVKVVETRVRQISEIRVFYEDNTWETFVLKK